MRSLPGRPLITVLTFILLAIGQVPIARGAVSPETKVMPHFDVLEYRIDGNTKLAVPTVERAVYPHLGMARTFDDVEMARSDLEKAYRDAGFGTVTVLIPEQQVKDGVVTLTVLEGRIDKLRVRNAHYFSQGRILENLPALQEGQVPDLKEVQKELASIETEDRQVTPLVRPGQSPGTTDVDLEVQDQLPLHGSLELNNYHTPQTTALRLQGSIDYDNLFQLDHRLGLQFQISPEDISQVKVFGGSYSVPMGGQTLVYSVVRSISSSFAGGGIGIFGNGVIAGVHDIITLPGSAGFTASLNAGLDYKDFQQNVDVPSAGGFGSPVHYWPFSLAYSAQLSNADVRWDANASFLFAARNFDSNAGDFDNKRFDATNSFSILRFTLARTETFDNKFSLYTRVDGQLTGQPLISNEQYVAGGVDSVRGYLDASQTGDSALRGTIELRSPSLIEPQSGIQEVKLHGFVDGAVLRELSPLPGTASAYELASLGLGLRLRADHGGIVTMDLAWPTKESTQQRAWSPRLQASTSLSF